MSPSRKPSQKWGFVSEMGKRMAKWNLGYGLVGVFGIKSQLSTKLFYTFRLEVSHNAHDERRDFSLIIVL